MVYHIFQKIVRSTCAEGCQIFKEIANKNAQGLIAMALQNQGNLFIAIGSCSFMEGQEGHYETCMEQPIYPSMTPLMQNRQRHCPLNRCTFFARSRRDEAVYRKPSHLQCEINEYCSLLNWNMVQYTTSASRSRGRQNYCQGESGFSAIHISFI